MKFAKDTTSQGALFAGIFASEDEKTPSKFGKYKICQFYDAFSPLGMQISLPNSIRWETSVVGRFVTSESVVACMITANAIPGSPAAYQDFAVLSFFGHLDKEAVFLIVTFWIHFDIAMHVVMTILQCRSDKEMKLTQRRLILFSPIPVFDEKERFDAPKYPLQILTLFGGGDLKFRKPSEKLELAQKPLRNSMNQLTDCKFVVQNFKISSQRGEMNKNGRFARIYMLTAYIAVALICTVTICTFMLNYSPRKKGLGFMSCTHEGTDNEIREEYMC
ncbi:hypothetical protein Fcan01_08647 [Folsomia candida]|uniref:Uncharacterized protein n=1 Tax=Folsomia candida TaxID=158441 RepID=A0A226EEU7_FOLCA|nr:hypothetical protein Fcan01_08647 [Folsomia candida]